MLKRLKSQKPTVWLPLPLNRKLIKKDAYESSTGQHKQGASAEVVVGARFLNCRWKGDETWRHYLGFNRAIQIQKLYQDTEVQQQETAAISEQHQPHTGQLTHTFNTENMWTKHFTSRQLRYHQQQYDILQLVYLQNPII